MLHARADYNGRIIDVEGKIPKDEPVFVLRGQDVFALPVLKKYIELNDEMGIDSRISKLLREHMERIKNWHKKKLPDLPLETEFRGIDSPLETR